MQKSEKKQTVDILIPAYKPGEEFEELLRRLTRQTYPIRQILVINTEEVYWNPIWETYPSVTVRHIRKSEFDHAASRSLAAELSCSDIMVFMTMDALPADCHLIENLVKALNSEEDVAVAYARQLPKASCGYLERYTRTFNYGAESRCKTAEDLEEMGIRTFFCSDVCAAYRKDLFLKNGGFVEKAIFNEDMLYAAAAIHNGYGVFYAADARVYHSHNYKALQQFHRNFDLGVSQAEHPEVFAAYPSEGTGISLVVNTMVFLMKNRHIELIPRLILQSAMKYLGYRMGKAYQKLPKAVILWCTCMPDYWKK